jgi:hypothetical protein
MERLNRIWLTAPFTLLAMLVAGCSGTASAGPTCSEFIAMSDADKHDAVIDWAREHDGRIDPDNPEAGAGGFALFSDYGSLSMYCSNPDNGDHHLGNLTPSQ